MARQDAWGVPSGANSHRPHITEWANMNDRSIPVTAAIAALLWVAGLALILVDIATSSGTSHLGLYSTAAAAVLTVRGFLCQMQVRELEAYELGRESVRPIH